MRRRAERAKEAQGQRVQMLRVRTCDVHGGMLPQRANADESTALLAASIARRGLLQPIVVRPNGQGYALICGARRLAACRLLGFKEIDACLVQADAQEAAAMALESQMTVVPLRPMEEAQIIRRFDGERLCECCALSEAAILRRLRLLDLPDAVQQIVHARDLSLAQAEPLLAIDDEARQIEAALIIAERALTPMQARRFVHGPQKKPCAMDSGRRRMVRQAMEAITRLAGEIRAQGMAAQVRVQSQEGGLCIQMLLAHGEKSASGRSFPSDGEMERHQG